MVQDRRRPTSDNGLPRLGSSRHVLAELRPNGLGVLTLNRPDALNALTLAMVRDLTSVLLHWQYDNQVTGVLLQGVHAEGKAPAFCAGGDIRALHRAAMEGDPLVDDFFTEEYALNHLIQQYGKTVIAVMDGLTLGGGMGLAQAAKLRVATERSQLGMPETLIGLFPDVAGGWFLSHAPGRLGEYLALTGQSLNGPEAIACELADVQLDSADLPAWLAAWPALAPQPVDLATSAWSGLKSQAQPAHDSFLDHQGAIYRHFTLPTLSNILDSLAADSDPWAQDTLALLSKRSPLMMAVALEQVRRARHMGRADAVRMERGMVRHCFHRGHGHPSETLEGIRARVIDKDQQPRWNPASAAEVTTEMVAAFFVSPWPAWAHPLRHLA